MGENKILRVIVGFLFQFFIFCIQVLVSFAYNICIVILYTRKFLYTRQFFAYKAVHCDCENWQCVVSGSDSFSLPGIVRGSFSLPQSLLASDIGSFSLPTVYTGENFFLLSTPANFFLLVYTGEFCSCYTPANHLSLHRRIYYRRTTPAN